MIPYLNRSRRTAIIAHRGARAYAPENTLAAFQKAINLTAADAIELDVQRTADGIPVVFHDATLTRTTDAAHKLTPVPSGGYPLHHFTLAQLQKLDAGRWFVQAHQAAMQGQDAPDYLTLRLPEELNAYLSTEDLEYYASGAVTIPTLASVLTWAQGAGIGINIELKPGPSAADTQLAQQVVALVQSHEMASRTLISSFSTDQLRHVHFFDPALPTALLADTPLKHVEPYLQTLHATAYHPGCTPPYDALSPQGEMLISRLQEAGYGVNIWTCNDKLQMARWIAAGVCGIISDLPNRVRDMVALHAALPQKKITP
ncbi:glycerophosphodiester phosphodiesterase [Magnetococcus sp. PR-3]|uniref:glycerophosphodiester phosphodiesterase n=1 Tax=Magnetococcus sp. PR-3 TaxID=3120355 RepID=UPI002FCDF0D0